MGGAGFVFIEIVGILVSIILFLVQIGLVMWFGWAFGSVVNDENGGFCGLVIGLVVGIFVVFDVWEYITVFG